MGEHGNRPSVENRALRRVAADIPIRLTIRRETAAQVAARSWDFSQLSGVSAVLLVSGTSGDVSVKSASLYKANRGLPVRAIPPPEYVARSEWSHLVISCTGQTTEIVEGMELARRAGARVHEGGGDPLLHPVMARLFAIGVAKAHSINPYAAQELNGVVTPAQPANRRSERGEGR